MVIVSSYVSVGEIENRVITIYLIVDTFMMWEQTLGSFFGQENPSPYHVRHEELFILSVDKGLFYSGLAYMVRDGHVSLHSQRQ